MTEPFTFTPVAVYHSAAKYPYEAPRQGVYSRLPGTVVFPEDGPYAAALADLQGFDRIWLIFVFHHVQGEQWKPFVAPPVTDGKEHHSLFSTRSPHRPNPIGLSCVRLLAIKENILTVTESDLLDGTPILDVKPYIPEIECFPDSAAGWRDHIFREEWQIVYEPQVTAAFAFVKAHTGLDLENFCHVQLRFDPLNRKRKRLSGTEECLYLHCRTWKMALDVFQEQYVIRVKSVQSNYSAEELLPDAPDPYGDKEAHRLFVKECIQ